MVCVFADGEPRVPHRSVLLLCCWSGGREQPLKMMEHSASDSETEDHAQPLLRREDTGDLQKGSRTLTMNAYYVFMQMYNIPRNTKCAGTIRAIILVLTK